ncbi:MAG: hypothetical protein GYA34_07090 [Chloroflexi bacterium]|nr:hypothetical protein [Chloroflexota bacterium]
MKESDDPGHSIKAQTRVKLPGQGKTGRFLFNLVELPKDLDDSLEDWVPNSPRPEITPSYLYNLHKTLRVYDCRLRYP